MQVASLLPDDSRIKVSRACTEDGVLEEARRGHTESDMTEAT